MVQSELTTEDRIRVNELLEEAFYNLDIYSLVEIHTSSRLNPARSGKQATGACPYDDCLGDTDGFIVFPTLSRLHLDPGDKTKIGRHYFCRNCRRSGHIINLLMGVCNLKFGATCELLDIPNPYLALKGEQQSGERKPTDPRVLEARERQRKELEARKREEQEEQDTFTMLYPRMQAMLLKHERPGQYLKDRAITLEQAKDLGLAYIPPLEEIRITSTDKEERKKQIAFFKRWNDRLLFPLTSRAGKGFTGRALSLWTPGMSESEHKTLLDQSGIPRYRTTHITGYFNASILASATHITIVEGAFDALALLAANVPDVLATCGKSVDISFIPVTICDATLAYDGDESGVLAAKEWKRAMERKGIETTRISPPLDGMGKDWSERYKRYGAAGLYPLFEPAHVEPMIEQLEEMPALCYTCLNENIETPAYYEQEEIMYCEKHKPLASAIAFPCCQCAAIAEHASPSGDRYCTEHYKCARGHVPQWAKIPGTDTYVCECVIERLWAYPAKIHDEPIVNVVSSIFGDCKVYIDAPGYTIQERAREVEQMLARREQVEQEARRAKVVNIRHAKKVG